MRKARVFWALVLLPFLIMVVVNETSEAPTFSYYSKKCTRYCHNHGCLHVYTKYDIHSKGYLKAMDSLYKANIQWLKHNGLGLSYAEINLLLYVIVLPLLMLLLLWGAVR